LGKFRIVAGEHFVGDMNPGRHNRITFSHAAVRSEFQIASIEFANALENDRSVENAQEMSSVGAPWRVKDLFSRRDPIEDFALFDKDVEYVMSELVDESLCESFGIAVGEQNGETKDVARA
jgi:hypothetical protein